MAVALGRLEAHQRMLTAVAWHQGMAACRSEVVVSSKEHCVALAVGREACSEG